MLRGFWYYACKVLCSIYMKVNTQIDNRFTVSYNKLKATMNHENCPLPI